MLIGGAKDPRLKDRQHGSTFCKTLEVTSVLAKTTVKMTETSLGSQGAQNTHIKTFLDQTQVSSWDEPFVIIAEAQGCETAIIVPIHPN